MRREGEGGIEYESSEQTRQYLEYRKITDEVAKDTEVHYMVYRQGVPIMRISKIKH